MDIRRGRAGDLEAILAIYNHYVVHSEATFDTERQTAAGRAEWFADFGDEHPCFVCEIEGVVVGYAYYTPYRARPAYAGTKETSVYVAVDAQGAGVGKALYAALIEHARVRGVHVLLGVLGGSNPASVGLHRHFGFEPCGHLREVGNKFGRFVDTHFYQKML